MRYGLLLLTCDILKTHFAAKKHPTINKQALLNFSTVLFFPYMCIFLRFPHLLLNILILWNLFSCVKDFYFE